MTYRNYQFRKTTFRYSLCPVRWPYTSMFRKLTLRNWRTAESQCKCHREYSGLLKRAPERHFNKTKPVILSESYESVYSKVHLHEIFWFLFLHVFNLYRPKNKVFEWSRFYFWNCQNSRNFDHSGVTQLMCSLIACHLCHWGVRLNVDWVNRRSTKSMPNDENFKYKGESLKT
jgi:hypothetical protein